ncbi:MAG TPA: VOC family protein [Phycisphaerae bacterium]|nr:VOC family protein [Phycisphaerae bacterium]
MDSTPTSSPEHKDQSTAPPITGVAEIVLSVRDLPQMREFYRSVLGFGVFSEGCYETQDGPTEGGEPTICFLTIREIDTPLGRHGHPQLLALIDHRRHVFARPRFDGHDVRRSTLNHLAFEIPPESYDAHNQRLVALGLNPTYSEFPAMNAKAIFFKDPEGNTLELICHSPPTSD